jgi:hypothetical protein
MLEAAGLPANGLWLWIATVASGFYHAVNPGMGWPLAVSAGLMGRGRRDVIAALVPLAAGHLLAMTVVLVPFAVARSLLQWEREIRLAAGVIVAVAGLYLLINRRHPRFLARIKPTQLALWSFAIAMAHGAGFLLVPIFLGMDVGGDTDPDTITSLGGNAARATLVSLVHAGTHFLVGGLLAIVVYEWFGLSFISKSWFNLGAVWAVSLLAVGLLGVAMAL